MPKSNSFWFISTDFDVATQASSRALKKLYNEYTSKQLYAGSVFTCHRSTFEYLIQNYDPKTIYIASHGNENTIIDQSQNAMIDEANVDKLAGRCLYAWACLAGKSLIPKAITKGCKVAIAYDVEVVAFVHQNPDGTWDFDDDTFDVFSKPIRSLCEYRKTFQQAYNETLERYDYWINYYKDISAIRSVFESNKAGLKLYGDGSQVALMTPLQQAQQQIQEMTGAAFTSILPTLIMLSMIKSLFTAFTRETKRLK